MSGFKGWKGEETGTMEEGENGPMEEGENGPMEEEEEGEGYNDGDSASAFASASAASFGELTDDWDNPMYDDMPITLDKIELLQGTFPPAEIKVPPDMMKLPEIFKVALLAAPFAADKVPPEIKKSPPIFIVTGVDQVNRNVPPPVESTLKFLFMVTKVPVRLQVAD